MLRSIRLPITLVGRRVTAVALFALIASAALSGVPAHADVTPASVTYSVNVQTPAVGFSSPFDMTLHFNGSALVPDPFGGVQYQVPAGWPIADGASVPIGDNVAALRIALDIPSACPFAAAHPEMVGAKLVVPLYNAPLPVASADPSGIPVGLHLARWAGRLGFGPSFAIPVNVLVDTDTPTGGTMMTLFLGDRRLPPRFSALPYCFNFDISLAVRGLSNPSGAIVSTNPSVPGTYTFGANVAPFVSPLVAPVPLPPILHLTAPVQIGFFPVAFPPSDTDGDGVLDVVDACPEDVGPASNNGCPLPLDSDRDGIPDLVELIIGTNPTVFDSSGDGYGDGQKIALGKDPTVYCAIMRADVDNDGVVSILDLSHVAKNFGQSVPPAPVRSDQDADNVISILDLAKQASAFGKPATLCP
jgi:hypothetical protein